MYPEDCWAALLEDLRSWAAEVVAGPDRIEVHWTWPGGAPRMATVVMTEDEWDGVVGIHFGSFERAVADLRSQLHELSGPHRFLVHQDYCLLPSTTPQLPGRDGLEDLPTGPVPGARWYAIGPDGREYPFPEPPPRPR